MWSSILGGSSRLQLCPCFSVGIGIGIGIGIGVDVQYRFTVTRAEEEDPYSSILAKLFTGEWRFPSTSRVPPPELEPEPGPESLIHKYVPSTTAFGIVGKTVYTPQKVLVE